MAKRLSAEEKRQNEALNRWINSSDEMQDIARKYENQFAFLLVPFRQRIMEHGYAHYADITDADIDKHIEKRKEDNARKEKEEFEKTGRKVHYLLDEEAERSILIMCRSFAELSHDDRQAILSIRTFLDR